MICAVLLLSITTATLACSAVPTGQEVRITIQGDGLITIPLELAYTFEKADVGTKFPKMCSTSADAVKNLENYMKRGIRLAIQEEARRAGVENLVTDIAKQIKPTIYYVPMNCSKADTKAIAPNGPGNACVVKNDIITNVSYDTTNAVDIPEQFQHFTLSLVISNYVISGWSRDMWDTIILKAQRQLSNGTYGTSFRTVILTQI